MAWSWLQSVSSVGGPSLSSRSATFTTANLTSGSKLIACVLSDSAGSITGVTDGSNSFSLMFSGSFGASDAAAIYQLDTPAGDAGTKPTITASVSGSGYICLLVQEVSGLNPGTTAGTVLDGTPGTLAGAGTNFTTGSPSYASAASGEYLLSVLWTNSAGAGDTPTGPAGYTQDAHDQTGATNGALLTLWAGYKSSTGGTEAGSYSDATAASTAWMTALAAFKLAGSGLATSPAYATAAADLGGGTGSWASPANADGAPDSTWATWTAP